ncbi:MAG TPA: hypothetical protein VNV65_12470 [Candidatus Solibacter sp.]|nr:hypothetical protein [Candidatus Solibacter sp.]
MATKKRGAKPAAGGSDEGALSRAEHRIEKAVRDAVAEVENRVLLAGEAADESTSSEVNILSSLEVAIHPPNPESKARRKKRS